MTDDPHLSLMPPDTSALLVFWCRCGQKIKVRRKQLGRSGPCPRCHREVIPTEDNTVASDEGPPTPAPEPCRTPPPPSIDDSLLRHLLTERDRLCAELGALAYEERILLPRNRGIAEAVRAITDCDARIIDLKARSAASRKHRC